MEQDPPGGQPDDLYDAVTKLQLQAASIEQRLSTLERTVGNFVHIISVDRQSHAEDLQPVLVKLAELQQEINSRPKQPYAGGMGPYDTKPEPK